MIKNCQHLSGTECKESGYRLELKLVTMIVKFNFIRMALGGAGERGTHKHKPSVS